jgi:hypothetical protein
MKNMANTFLKCVLLSAIMALTGCASSQQYNKAFDSQNALVQNQCSFSQPADTVFKVTKQIFVQRGFTIENADMKSGIMKAVRNMADKEDEEISYNIHASADISEITPEETQLSLAASQQTILHRSSLTWWKLLWILPLFPTGTEYQTLVIKEGNITDPVLYNDFCNAVRVEATKQDVALKAAAAKAAEKAAAKAKTEADKAAAEKAAVQANAAAVKASADAKAATQKAAADKIADAEKIQAAKDALKKEVAKIAADLEQKAAVDAAPAQ